MDLPKKVAAASFAALFTHETVVSHQACRQDPLQPMCGTANLAALESLASAAATNGTMAFFGKPEMFFSSDPSTKKDPPDEHKGHLK